MTSRYFQSTEQTEAHQASVIVYWGDDFPRPNLIVGVVADEQGECENCSEPSPPLQCVTFDMDDSIAEAFELAVARWREVSA